MTIFHYINVRMQNIPKFVSKIGVDFMHCAIKEWASKSMYVRSKSKSKSNIPAKELGIGGSG
jgi:hypothetical protein